MQMHVCIMSSLLQQVEESIGLFISGLRPAQTGRAPCPRACPWACLQAPCPRRAGRPAGIFCFCYLSIKWWHNFFCFDFIAGWWQTYAASLRLHLRRRAAGCCCCRRLRWPQNLHPKLTHARTRVLRARSSHQDPGYCECARNQ